MGKRRKPEEDASNGHGEVTVTLEEPPVGPLPSEPEDHGDQPNRPVHVVRFGLVRAAIWVNQTEYGPRHHVTVSRLYKGSDDRWYHTSTFGYKDLLPLSKALDLAHTWVSEVISSGDIPF